MHNSYAPYLRHKRYHMIRRYIKQRCPWIFKVLRAVYRLTRLDLPYKKYKAEKFRKECFSRYLNGEEILETSFGGIQVKYKAISPKNYWHLMIGSQYENEFAQYLFCNCLKEGMIVLDIGAHTGMYTIPFAIKVGPSGKVYAFEPEKKGFEAVKDNIALNKCTNVVPLNMAISDMKGVVDFYIRPDKDTHSLFEKTLSPSPLGIQEKIRIETSTVDDLIEAGVILAPDFVKIDTEGAELKILNGIKKSAKHIKYILIEIHISTLNQEGIGEPKIVVEEELKSMGFKNQLYLDEIHILAWK